MDVTGSSDKKQELMDENTRLNELITKCQSKTHQVGIEVDFIGEAFIGKPFFFKIKGEK